MEHLEKLLSLISRRDLSPPPSQNPNTSQELGRFKECAFNEAKLLMSQVQ